MEKGRRNTQKLQETMTHSQIFRSFIICLALTFSFAIAGELDISEFFLGFFTTFPMKRAITRPGMIVK